MVKLSTVVLFAFGSFTVAQRDWVRGGQSGRPPNSQTPAPQTRATPKTSNPPRTIITPQSQPQSQSQIQPPWQQSKQDPPPWQAQPTPTPAPAPAQTSKNQPPPTPAPQQGPPFDPAPQQGAPFAQAICTVEIYSFTTRPEGQRTRTRTRTIIAPYISTITSLITTDTTSIAVETIVQEQREQTITSSQTICN